MKKYFFFFLLLACSFSHMAQAANNITVYAAASLTNALDEITTEYEKNNEVKIINSFASSSTLARQISEGAPADLFISADQQWMDYIAKQQLIVPESRINLLGNSLVVIVPVSNKVTTFDVKSLASWKSNMDNGRIAVGDPDHVPVGIYAKEALTNLGLWQQLSQHLAAANNTRAALAFVERDEANLGIVYSTDAKASKLVKVIATFPTDSYKNVTYPLAIVKGKDRPDVNAFYHFLLSDQAKVIFNKYGFTLIK